MRSRGPASTSRPSRVRRVACWLAGLVVAVAGPARAVAPYENASTCRLAMPADELASLALDPRAMLSDYPDGGERMAWRVRVIAAAGPDGLRALARGIVAANAAQKEAIGEGAARAAAACDGRDGAVTTRIMDWVRAAADGEVTRAFVRYLVIAPDAAASPSPVSAPRATPGLGGRLDAPARDVATPVGVEPWTPWR